MHRHGKTSTGKERYKCPRCGKTSTIHRPDTRQRHIHDHFVDWLTGKKTISEVAGEVGISRQELNKQFRPLFEQRHEPVPPDDYRPRWLVVDGTYVHGNQLCVLIAIDEKNNIWWKFVKSESYLAWAAFFEQFPHAPDLVVADGQKGLYGAHESVWPDTDFQRCQFHVIQRVHQHITRTPQDKPAQELLAILYRLKEVHNEKDATMWRLSYNLWEAKHGRYLKEQGESGEYVHKRLRGARTTIRKAWPHLFTFLEHEGAPHTTNLVEGWTNAAIAEAVRRHRGLKLHQKKTLVSIILSHLKRKK